MLKKAQHLSTCKFEVTTIVAVSSLDMTLYAEKWNSDEDYDISLDKDSYIMSYDK
jgi:hypothetical protein